MLIFNGQKLKSLRINRKLSGADLAMMICVSRQAINQYERGMVPGGIALMDLCDVLAVNPSELFTVTKEVEK
jgi:transcriptional regulator with XRE-family HTH domain